MQQGPGPAFDVVSVEEGGDFAAEGITDVPALTILAFRDPFFEADDPDPSGFERRGEVRGYVSSAGISGFAETTFWHLRFESVDGASTMDAEGHLSKHPDGRPGGGRLTVVDATGDWAGIAHLGVVAMNPRRWTAIP